MKITLLVGLPGSGKSWLGAHLENAKSCLFIDDISVVGIDELKEAIAFGWEEIVVSDTFLCCKEERVKALKWLKDNASDYKIECIFFENSPQKCYENIKRRNLFGDTRKVEELLAELTKKYTIPKYVVPREVFSIQ